MPQHTAVRVCLTRWSLVLELRRGSASPPEAQPLKRVRNLTHGKPRRLSALCCGKAAEGCPQCIHTLKVVIHATMSRSKIKFSLFGLRIARCRNIYSENCLA